MQIQNNPVSWLAGVIAALQWPVVVIAAFVLGRYISKLESRVLKAEANVAMLIERHMPHIHRALSELKESVEVIRALLGASKLPR
jgi:hypothetical protein